MALSVEVSEILEIFQWKDNDEELTKEEQQDLAYEIGDVLIYLLELADNFDIEPARATHRKLELNQQKYPAEQVRGKALKYTQYYHQKEPMLHRPYKNLKNKDLVQRIKDEQYNPCSLLELASELTKRSKISKKKKYALYEFIVQRLHETKYNDEPPPLTREIAERGIYIDFECYRDEEPTLLGILIYDNFNKAVFSDDLKPAAEVSNARLTTLESAIADILDLATRECRRIIAYSEHDLNKIKEYTNLGENVEYFYTNARKIAESWQKEHFKAEEIDNSLKSVAEKIGKPYPKYLLKKNPTTIIGDIKERLLEENKFENLPDQTKNDWENLLQYNWRDCWVMRELLIQVTN